MDVVSDVYFDCPSCGKGFRKSISVILSDEFLCDNKECIGIYKITNKMRSDVCKELLRTKNAVLKSITKSEVQELDGI